MRVVAVVARVYGSGIVVKSRHQRKRHVWSKGDVGQEPDKRPLSGFHIVDVLYEIKPFCWPRKILFEYSESASIERLTHIPHAVAVSYHYFGDSCRLAAGDCLLCPSGFLVFEDDCADVIYIHSITFLMLCNASSTSSVRYSSGTGARCTRITAPSLARCMIDQACRT